MIAALLTLAYAAGALALGRAALRRGWHAHAITAGVCAAVLAVAAILLAVGEAVLPGWLLAAGIAVDVLLIAVTVDVSRAMKREAAR